MPRSLKKGPFIDLHLMKKVEVAIESNGTLPLPKGVDWICLSPKADAKVVQDSSENIVFGDQFPNRCFFE